MKRILIGFLFMTALINAMELGIVEPEAELVTPYSPLNLIMILEDGVSEGRGKAGATTDDLVDALKKPVAPIMVTSAVLDAFFAAQNTYATEAKKNPAIVQQWKQITEKIRKKDDALALVKKKVSGWDARLRFLYEQKEQKQTTLHYLKILDDIDNTKKSKEVDELTVNELSTDVNAAFEEFHDLKNKYPFLTSYCAYHTSLTTQEWLMYKHAHADLFLLIPKKYEQKILSSAAMPKPIAGIHYTNRELRLGMPIDHTTILTPITSLEELKKTVDKKWNKWHMQLARKSQIVAYLTFPSVPLERIKECFIKGKDAHREWQIFLTGHGSFTREKFLKTSGEDPYLTIAGLKFEDFKDFLKFLKNDINVSLFYFNSCYAGGHNLDKTAQFLQQLAITQQLENKMSGIVKKENVGFVIVSQALTDAPTMTSSCGIGEGFNFATFFTHLPSLTAIKKVLNALNIPGHRRESFARLLITKDLQRSLKAIDPVVDSSDYYAIASTPSVWIPGWKQFKVVENEGAIVSLNKALLLKHGLIGDEKDKPLTLAKVKVILLYQPEYSMPLLLYANEGDGIGFVSMIPGNAHHAFDQVTIYDGPGYLKQNFETFMRYGIFHLDSLYAKLFTFKVLEVGIPYSLEQLFGIELSNTGLMEDVYVLKVGTQGLLDRDIKTSGAIIFKVKDRAGKYHSFKAQWDNELKVLATWQELTEKQAQEERAKMRQRVG